MNFGMRLKKVFGPIAVHISETSKMQKALITFEICVKMSACFCLTTTSSVLWLLFFNAP